MNAIPAPASLFRANALSTYDVATGAHVPWLTEGFHLRVKLNPWIGFPLHPFAAWRIPYGGEPHQHPQEGGELQILWTGANGQALSVPFDLRDAGGSATGATLGTDAANPWIWMDFDIDYGGDGVRLDLLDMHSPGNGTDRILATRRQSPFRFGHTQITRFRVSGEGAVRRVRAIRFSDLALEDYFHKAPDFVFGLPQPSGNWYAADPTTDPRAEAIERVKIAAPRRLSPPDNPAGNLPDDTDPGAEAGRIADSVAPDLVDPWLADGFTGPEVAPVHAVRTGTGDTGTGAAMVTSAPVTPSLLTMAVDPQIARYLGLATTIPYGETAEDNEVDTWVIASRWAVQRNRTVLRHEGLNGGPVTLDEFLRGASSPAAITSRLNEKFPDAEHLMADVVNRQTEDGHGEWSIVTLFAVAVSAGDAPPDAPDPFMLAAGAPGAWNAHGNPQGPGPESWRQQVSLGTAPSRGMVGFARMSPGEPVPLQRQYPPPGTGLPTRVLPLVPNWASNNRRLVTDRDVPPHPDGAGWQVWQADEFGQWSQGATLKRPLPPRPVPPPPQVEATYTPKADDGSSGLRVPGRLRLRYVVPAPANGAPGSLPIAGLRITVDGVPLPPMAVTTGETVATEAEPGPFRVGQQRRVPVVAMYVDADGAESEAGTTACHVYDARAPRAVPTSPVILWTGEPDATGQAELALRWPPREGAARYRVYLGDARRLADAAGVALPDSHVRSKQAGPIHAAGGGLADKQLFTFLGEVAGTPAGDGNVHFRTRIPGALRSVQFVRVVPLTEGGAEAAFAACGLVPVAVPGTDRPPTPALDAVTGPASGLTLTVRALGLRAHLLAASPGGAAEYRIRRTLSSTKERTYAPVWGSGVLGPAADGIWTAALTVPAADLVPFVRTTWLAEVRYPAEPPIPPGVSPVPVAGGVEPVWSSVGDVAEAAWSDPSLAAESLLIPPDGPAVPEVARTQAADGSPMLTVTGLPVAHRAAVAPYGLEFYRGLPGIPAELASSQTISAAELTWTESAPVPAGVHYDVLVVDPIGRRSLPRRV
ncbi:hypothetical protein [Pseudarthrobacter sulfonivorans]|uniref:hypothetical protein n=1 Tax=Pseudarthrobacter sulfonivorans TaxID=121292 RepID=UPI0028607BA4|nr:hypothetical protein [Pseudarthrobacter sulfonivorans]MDR6413320.1 hypothetical protein [Pseudarthrobacter sulfonivorans]